MKKTAVYLSCLLLMLVSTVSTATPKRVAVEISIGGIGPGVDEAALQTVRQVIGSGIGQGVVNKFIVNDYARPIEGGFTGCVQASPYTDQFIPFVKQLKAIKANPMTSFYNVRWIPACKDYKPLSKDPVMCTMDVKQCPNGKYVGRTGPDCAFAPCPK